MGRGEGRAAGGGRAGDQHIVGEIEDGEVEADRVDVEVHEVAYVAVDQAVVAIAEGTGHDQAESDGQEAVVVRASDEQPVDDGEARQDERGPRRCRLPNEQIAAEAPDERRYCRWSKPQDIGDEGLRGEPGGPTWPRSSVWWRGRKGTS